MDSDVSIFLYFISLKKYWYYVLNIYLAGLLRRLAICCKKHYKYQTYKVSAQRIQPFLLLMTYNDCLLAEWQAGWFVVTSELSWEDGSSELLKS